MARVRATILFLWIATGWAMTIGSDESPTSASLVGAGNRKFISEFDAPLSEILTQTQEIDFLVAILGEFHPVVVCHLGLRTDAKLVQRPTLAPISLS